MSLPLERLWQTSKQYNSIVHSSYAVPHDQELSRYRQRFAFLGDKAKFMTVTASSWHTFGRLADGTTFPCTPATVLFRTIRYVKGTDNDLLFWSTGQNS